jgi:hypothetical protein
MSWERDFVKVFLQVNLSCYADDQSV